MQGGAPGEIKCGLALQGSRRDEKAYGCEGILEASFSLGYEGRMLVCVWSGGWGGGRMAPGSGLSNCMNGRG